MARYIFLLFVVSWALGVEAALAPFAQDYLNKIPEKKLTLEFVVQTALMNSDSYRIIGLQYQESDLEELSLNGETDTVFSGGTNYYDDNTVKDSQFQPARSKKWDWSLGFSKKWATGTRTSLNWVHEWNHSQFSSFTQSVFGNSFVPEFKRTTAVFNIEQSLLKDSFGYSYREKLKASKKRGEALKWKSQEDLENTTLAFIGEFYSAWLLQQQVGSLKEQVQRQKKLVRVMKRKNKKGAVEKPELIQVEALLSSTVIRYEQVKAQLITQWEKLVFGLKLPQEFIQVEPMDIPTKIDEPVKTGLKMCGLKDPRETATIMGLKKNLEAAKSDFAASKNGSLPDLKLIAGYRGTGLDSSGSQANEDVLDGKYNGPNPGLGPAWNVGLSLAWPLDNSFARVDRTKKYLTKEKIKAQLEIEKDSLKSSWRELCRNLRVESENEKTYRNVVLEQRKRVRAESRRFSLGRITVDQLVTAEDDLSNWEFQSHQKSIQVRQIAWNVQRVSGELYRKISPVIEARMKDSQ